MTPIDKAAEEAFDVLMTWRDAGARPGGGAADEIARAVFASIDTDELARALAVADGISWDIAHGAHKLRYLHFAEAVKAHLLKEDATDD